MSQIPTPVINKEQDEVRTLVIQRLDTRSSNESGTRIEGIAVVYDEFTQIADYWGDTFYERIEKGALRDTLADGHVIFALKNHNWNDVLGRTGANLTLADQSDGLRFELVPNQSTLGRDMLEDVRSGLITGCSFGFKIVDQDWDNRDNAWFRTIKKLELREITLTPLPAYSSTTAEVRSLRPGQASPPQVSVGNSEQEERNAILAEANRIQNFLK